MPATRDLLTACRPYDKDDYPTLLGWWEKHGVPPVPQFYLPDCGLVAIEDGHPTAAAWVYFDNSIGLAWFAWLVSNPAVSPVVAERGMRSLLAAAEEICRAQNRPVLFVEAPRASLEKWYRRQGFLVNHPTVHLTKAIQCQP